MFTDVTLATLPDVLLVKDSLDGVDTVALRPPGSVQENADKVSVVYTAPAGTILEASSQYYLVILTKIFGSGGNAERIWGDNVYVETGEPGWSVDDIKWIKIVTTASDRQSNIWIDDSPGFGTPIQIALRGTLPTGGSSLTPKAWIARFGRTVAAQTLDAVESRMRASRTPGVEIDVAGQSFGWSAGGGPAAGAGGLHPRTLTSHDLVTGSAFSLSAEAEGGGTTSVWGRGALTDFDGRDGDLTLDGEVASAMLGADWSRGQVTTGLILGYSSGKGGYRAPSGKSTVSASLTGLYPWGRYAVSDQVEIWGAAGYGKGELKLDPDDQDAVRTDLDLWMAAAGLRGTVIEGGNDELTLTATSDAMTVETSTDAVSGDLAALEARVTRLRLGLEGTWPVLVGDGSTLTPSAEIGMRQDSGDAETGFGADIGAGIAWRDHSLGLSADLHGRGLLIHEAKGFRHRGLSGSFRWDRTTGGRGPRLSLTQTIGAAVSGGTDAVLQRGAFEGIRANDRGNGDLRRQSLEARFGYGLAAVQDGFTWTPEAGVSLSDTGRDYSLGWRLVRVKRGSGIAGGSLELSFEAMRRESAGETKPSALHEAGIRLISRF